MLRNPRTRYVSAWHYRCHNPNYDCFGVRKEFMKIRYGRAKKKTFEEYLAMPEYQNVMTKMLALDKLPYGDYGPLTLEHLETAKERLLEFTFVGVNEMYDSSLVLMSELLQIPLLPQDFDKERTQDKPAVYVRFAKKLKSNTTLQQAVLGANALDADLYEFGRQQFCRQLQNSVALEHPMIETELNSAEKNVCLDIWAGNVTIDTMIIDKETDKFRKKANLRKRQKQAKGEKNWVNRTKSHLKPGVK